MVAHNDKPLLYCQTPAEWRDWLANAGQDSVGVRLQLVKKSSALPGISYAQALDEALCFGWIDGQTSSLDDDFFIQSFTPRKPRSVWSKRNREYVARLVSEGRMQPAGLAQVDAAKADGRWDAAYGQGDAVPDDLQAAIDASPAASAFFLTLNSQNRFAIIFRTNSVKRAETRAKKIAGFVAMLERGETVYPPTPATGRAAREPAE
ncbi:YdeI/OmpD-associated family protein [Homoserinimonas sp. A447]